MGDVALGPTTASGRGCCAAGGRGFCGTGGLGEAGLPSELLRSGCCLQGRPGDLILAPAVGRDWHFQKWTPAWTLLVSSTHKHTHSNTHTPTHTPPLSVLQLNRVLAFALLRSGMRVSGEDEKERESG